jgi:hypothetical protein
MHPNVDSRARLSRSLGQSFGQSSRRLNPFDLGAIVLIAALLGLVLLTFRDYSISNDEAVQHRYGEMIIAYYRSGLADRSLFNFDNLYLYGGLFDVLALLLGHVLPGDIYAVRHVLCAMIGIAGIAAAWSTARMIAGPRAGALAALSLAVCGAWYGTMFNHTKDIPFAAAMIGATYFLLRAVRGLPRPRLGDLVCFGLLLGAALGQRALGLLLIVYVPFAIALYTPRELARAEAFGFFGRSLVRFAPAFMLGYLIMIAAWPWSAIRPFNAVRAVFAFTHFAYPIETLLAGHTYLMAQVPRTYEPIYLAIKLPLIMLFGAALGLLAIAAARRSNVLGDRLRARETGFVAFTAALPVLLHMAGHGPAFSGMRHFVFVVPPLAVLAGIGFDAALSAIGRRSRALAAFGLVCVGAWFIAVASVLVRLHPYEYLYFNGLVGGLAGADQRYDTDYWVNVMHDAVAGLEHVLDREKHSSAVYRVAVCSEATQFLRDPARRPNLTLATGDEPADFFIAPTHMRCDRAVDGKVIVKIERMGTVIGVVKDRRALTRANAAATP